MFGNPVELLVIAGAAILLFGADKVPKLARSLGQAKAEFMAGHSETPAAAKGPEAQDIPPKETPPGPSA